MDIAETTFDEARLRQARIANSAVFVILGVLVGTLAARMPAIKHHAGLSDGMLGFALLGLPTGSLVSIQVVGRCVARWGSSPLAFLGAAVLSVASMVPPFASNFVTLLATTIFFGLGMGLVDTSMNAQAVTIEQHYKRPIMSSFHGYYSVGALLGAGTGSIAAHLGLGTQPHFVITGVVALALAIALRSFLLPGSADTHNKDEREAGDHKAAWSAVLVLLAITAFMSMLAEMAVSDWSAVYLRDNLRTTAGVAAYGFAVFSFTMLCARFLGDSIIARVGSANVLRWGGLSAGIALIIGLVSNNVAAVIVAWGIVGIGMASVVPICFGTAGNLSGVPHGGAIGKVAGVGYTGSLVGPPLIGLFAQATTLKTALFVTAAACLVVGLVGPLGARRSVS